MLHCALGNIYCVTFDFNNYDTMIRCFSRLEKNTK
jgi:hypothetical protein